MNVCEVDSPMGRRGYWLILGGSVFVSNILSSVIHSCNPSKDLSLENEGASWPLEQMGGTERRRGRKGDIKMQLGS